MSTNPGGCLVLEANMKKQADFDIKPAEYRTTIDEVRIIIHFTNEERPEVKELIKSLLKTAYKEKFQAPV